MSAPLYETIAQTILTALEKGVRPWEQCYSISQKRFPIRVTGEDYKGINRIMLLIAMLDNQFSRPLWMTYHQAKQLGAQVRRGEKASLSVFYKSLEITDDDSGEVRTLPMMKANRVFNCDQIDNLPEDFLAKVLPPPQTYNTHPCIRAESFIQTLPANCHKRDGTPAFSPANDEIYMPDIQQFKTAEQYYATYLHELAHWTGHTSRLNRNTLNARDKTSYCREELVAELTASFLCPAIGIEPLIDEEHAPYLQHYITLLKDDPKAFVTACSQAEKAADYLKGFTGSV